MDFRIYLQRQLAKIGQINAEAQQGTPADEVAWDGVYEQYRDLISQTELEAAKAGVPGAVEACRKLRSGPIGDCVARQVLAECLAACPPEQTLTPTEVANELSVSPDTVFNWIKTAQLKASNLGTKKPRYVVTRENLNDFLKKREPEPPAKQQSKVQSSFKRY